MEHSTFPRLCPCGVVHPEPPPSAVQVRPYFAAAATVQLQVFSGADSAAAGVSGESGFKYNRENSVSGTTPIPIPTAAGTNYSWIKNLGLAVTATGTTSMSNRRIQLSVADNTGLGIFFQAVAPGSYVQPAVGNMPASSASNGPATPAGYTRATTSLLAYDSTNTTATSVTGRNGNYCQTVLGVDSSAPGAGNNVALGTGGSTMDLRLVYDEAATPEPLLRDAVAWARDPLSTSSRRDRHCRRRGRGDLF